MPREKTQGRKSKVESTNAQVRGRLARSSDENPVMGLERRGWVIEVALGQLETGGTRNGNEGGQSLQRWHEPDELRGSSPDLWGTEGEIPSVYPVGWSEGGGSSTSGRANWRQEEPDNQRKAAAFDRWHEPDDARVSSPDL